MSLVSKFHSITLQIHHCQSHCQTVSLSVSENDCSRRGSRALSVSALRFFRHQSVWSFATKLLNFASFSLSLRNIEFIYSQNIMYIQSRTIRAKWDPSFPMPTLPKENLCRTQPLAVWASAREVSVTRGRRLPSACRAWSRLFKRVTQTVRDYGYLRSGRIIFYGVRKLLGKRLAGYRNIIVDRMLSEGQNMNNSLRQ